MDVSIVFQQEVVAISQHFAAKICVSAFTVSATLAEACTTSHVNFTGCTLHSAASAAVPLRRVSVCRHIEIVYASLNGVTLQKICRGTAVAWGIVGTGVSVQYTSFGMFFSNPAAFTHRISVFFLQIDAFRRPYLCDLQFLA